jgi:RHS repeat-associated protein
VAACGREHARYDNRDRLTAASAPGLWGNALFSYDALDNLKSADQGARQYRYVYDTNQRLARIIDPFGTTQMSFGYNPAGDQTSKNAQSYNFDAAHRLSAVASIASYVYDGFGRRVKEVKADGSQDIGVYSQSGQRLYSKRGAESTRHIYLGNTLLAQTKTVGGIPQPDTTLHTDALGSVVAESTASGSIQKRNDYAPWGEPISGPLDGLGYTGHEMDPDTGLVYAQQRYYDPIVGRFLSVDPVAADAGSGGNFNRYWYANNNPYKFTDPDGREACAGGSARTCVNADSFVASRSNGQTTQASPEVSQTMVDQKSQVAVTSGTKEKVGFVVAEGGGLKVQVAQNATTEHTSRTDSATATIPTGAVAVLHGHIDGQSDGVLSPGDAAPLAQGLPNGVVSEGRVGVTEIVGGRIQFRMIEGKMTPREARQQQKNLDKQQPQFLTPEP